MERMPSIFNDVLSPVTPGPSSSNTCGPYRIARLARALLGEPPRRITVRMARRGGYYGFMPIKFPTPQLGSRIFPLFSPIFSNA